MCETLSVRKTTGNYLLRMHFPKMFLRFLPPVSATFGKEIVRKSIGKGDNGNQLLLSPVSATFGIECATKILVTCMIAFHKGQCMRELLLVG